MADPLTSTIRLTQPTVSGDSGLWGGLLNSDLAYVDEAINQSITVSIADTNVTLTADGSSSDQARYLRYNFTGALTADRTVTLPANVKVGYASNNTTGGHNVILSAGGTTLSLTDSSWIFFQCDGTNVTAPTVALTIPKAAGASTSPLRADQAWQVIASYTPSSVSTQPIPLPSGFRRYRLTFQGLTVSANTYLGIQFSTNGGVSYITTASYSNSLLYNTQTGAAGNTASVSISQLTLSLNTTAGVAAEGTFDIYPGSASLVAMCNGRSSGDSSALSIWYTGQFLTVLTVGAAVNQIQLLPGSGTFSGTFILEGLP